MAICMWTFKCGTEPGIVDESKTRNFEYTFEDLVRDCARFKARHHPTEWLSGVHLQYALRHALDIKWYAMDFTWIAAKSWEELCAEAEQVMNERKLKV